MEVRFWEREAPCTRGAHVRSPPSLDPLRRSTEGRLRNLASLRTRAVHRRRGSTKSVGRIPRLQLGRRAFRSRALDPYRRGGCEARRRGEESAAGTRNVRGARRTQNCGSQAHETSRQDDHDCASSAVQRHASPIPTLDFMTACPTSRARRNSRQRKSAERKLKRKVSDQIKIHKNCK